MKFNADERHGKIEPTALLEKYEAVWHKIYDDENRRKPQAPYPRDKGENQGHSSYENYEVNYFTPSRFFVKVTIFHQRIGGIDEHQDPGHTPERRCKPVSAVVKACSDEHNSTTQTFRRGCFVHGFEEILCRQHVKYRSLLGLILHLYQRIAAAV